MTMMIMKKVSEVIFMHFVYCCSNHKIFLSLYDHATFYLNATWCSSCGFLWQSKQMHPFLVISTSNTRIQPKTVALTIHRFKHGTESICIKRVWKEVFQSHEQCSGWKNDGKFTKSQECSLNNCRRKLMRLAKQSIFIQYSKRFAEFLLEWIWQ